MDYTECRESETLMQDLDFLKRFAFDLIKDRIEGIYDRGEEGERFTESMIEYFSKSDAEIQAVLNGGNRTYESLMDAMYGHMWRGDLKSFLDSNDVEMENVNASSDAKLAAVGVLALQDPGPLGTFLAETLPLFAPEHFSPDLGRIVYFKSGLCQSKLNEGVNFVHEFLANLTGSK